MMRLKELVQGLTVEKMIRVVEQMPEDTQFSPSDCQRCIVAQVLHALSEQPICVTASLAGDHSRHTNLTPLLSDIVYDFDHQFTWNIDKRQALRFLKQEMEELQ